MAAGRYRHSLLLKPDYAKAHNCWQCPLWPKEMSARRSPATGGPWRFGRTTRGPTATPWSPAIRAGCDIGRTVGVARSMGCAAYRGIGRLMASAREPVRSRAAAVTGILSPDLGFHPVGYFLIRTIEALRTEPCETVCYSDRCKKTISLPIPQIGPCLARGPQPFRRGPGRTDPGRLRRYPLRSLWPYGPQPAAGVRPQAAPIRPRGSATWELPGWRRWTYLSQTGSMSPRGRMPIIGKRFSGFPTATFVWIRRRTSS